MSSPEMNLPHQELAAKSVERVDKLIDNAAAARVDAAAIASATERSAGLKERLKGLESGGNLDSATAAELSEDIAELETKLLTRGEIDKIPLDEKDSTPLDDAQKTHIKKLIFAKPSWLQEKIADPATSPEMVALYKAAVDARSVATENAGVEQAIKTQEAWGAHNNESTGKMMDIINKHLDSATSNSLKSKQIDLGGGHVRDAWEKMDEGSKEQLYQLIDGLVTETRHISKSDGTTIDKKRAYRPKLKDGVFDPVGSALTTILFATEKYRPGELFGQSENFDTDKSKYDLKPVADVGKKLREAYLASKAPKAK